MKSKNLFALIAATSVLSACGSGDSDVIGSCSTCNPPASGDPVSVITISGNTVTLDGTYSTGCVDRSLEGGGGYYTNVMTISGSSLSNSGAEYDDSGCTNVTDSGTIEATLSTAGAVGAIEGWTGAGDKGGPFIPTASDKSGPLSETEAFTVVTATIISGTGWNADIPSGFTIDLFHVVDDTSAKKVLYEDDDYFGGSLLAKNIAIAEQ